MIYVYCTNIYSPTKVKQPMAKTTVMHANSLPPFWYGYLLPHHTKPIENEALHKTNQLSFANTNVEKYTWLFTHPVIYTSIEIDQ
jgi:hypothetical protein